MDMQSSYEYSLIDFTENIAKLEAKFSESLLSVIETFTSSRVDLPLKKLDTIARAHMNASNNLKELINPAKNEYLNLWKFCNIFSVMSLEIDLAMRDIRSVLRSRLTTSGDVIEKPKRRVINMLESFISSTKSNSVLNQEKPSWRKLFQREEKKNEINNSYHSNGTDNNCYNKSVDLKTNNVNTENYYENVKPMSYETKINTTIRPRIEERNDSAHYAPTIYNKLQEINNHGTLYINQNSCSNSFSPKRITRNDNIITITNQRHDTSPDVKIFQTAYNHVISSDSFDEKNSNILPTLITVHEQT